MPIYEYRCKNCGSVTEKISRINSTYIACPACNEKAEKIVSLFSAKTISTPSSGGGCPPGPGFT